MKCWYFHFEGIKNDNVSDLKDVGTKLFSRALVPASERTAAVEMLNLSLAEYAVDLVNIEDDFLYDPDDVDEENAENAVWVNWHKEVVRFNAAIFEPWFTFSD